jgi:hypothetical protein
MTWGWYQATKTPSLVAGPGGKGVGSGVGVGVGVGANDTSTEGVDDARGDVKGPAGVGVTGAVAVDVGRGGLEDTPCEGGGGLDGPQPERNAARRAALAPLRN